MCVKCTCARTQRLHYVKSVGLHVLTKTVSDFVTLSKSGRLQAGSILQQLKKKKKRKKKKKPALHNDKTFNDKEFDCIRAEELAEISVSLFAPLGATR